MKISIFLYVLILGSHCEYESVCTWDNSNLPALTNMTVFQPFIPYFVFNDTMNNSYYFVADDDYFYMGVIGLNLVNYDLYLVLRDPTASNYSTSPFNVGLPSFNSTAGWNYQFAYFASGDVCLNYQGNFTTVIGCDANPYPYNLVKDFAGYSGNGFLTQIRLPRFVLSGGLLNCSNDNRQYEIILYVTPNGPPVAAVFPVQNLTVFSTYFTVNVSNHYACNYSCSIIESSEHESSKHESSKHGGTSSKHAGKSSTSSKHTNNNNNNNNGISQPAIIAIAACASALFLFMIAGFALIFKHVNKINKNVSEIHEEVMTSNVLQLSKIENMGTNNSTIEFNENDITKN